MVCELLEATMGLIPLRSSLLPMVNLCVWWCGWLEAHGDWAVCPPVFTGRRASLWPPCRFPWLPTLLLSWVLCQVPRMHRCLKQSLCLAGAHSPSRGCQPAQGLPWHEHGALCHMCCALFESQTLSPPSQKSTWMRQHNYYIRAASHPPACGKAMAWVPAIPSWITWKISFFLLNVFST